MNNYNEYETEEIMTDNLILMKGKEKDFLTVYEYDFRCLSDIDDVMIFKKASNDKIKKCFNRGSKVYYNKCKKAHMFDWIVYYDNNPIGNIFTTNEDENSNSVVLEFNLHPNYWGKGYMPESLVSVINYLFKIGYDNILCNYVDGNKKAKRVLSKLGFKPHGIKKDGYESIKHNKLDIYETIMEKEDWLSRTSKIKL